MADAGFVWDPKLYIGDTLVPRHDEDNYTFIILNSPIRNLQVFEAIMNHASYIICADGGANRLKEAAEENPGVFLPLPDLIHGDLDSITEETRAYFESRGVEVIEDDDKYSTDFTKCLRFLNRRAKKRVQEEGFALEDVVAWGSLEGRVDQALSQIHHLYMALHDPELQCIGKIYLITPQNISFLIFKGRNKIYTPLTDSGLAENIGIIPVGKPAVISTKGLEWDVKDWQTSFGRQISTSNHIKSDVVEIETNETILVTIELARKDK